MNQFALSRALYIIAGVAWLAMLWPYPVTLFMAASLACLSLPLYRRLHVRAARWRRQLRSKGLNTKWIRFIFGCTYHFPLLAYLSIIISCMVVPLVLLVVLVSPQAMAGIARLRELRANNFEMPPSFQQYIDDIRGFIKDNPPLDKIINDFVSNFDNLMSDAASILVSRSFGFVGSTMTMFWLLFLFLTLSVLMIVYSELLKKICCRILNVPAALIHRFTNAVYRALKAILLGIVLVALIQGILCGIGFAVAGVGSPAFWGLLATMAAPIPMLGTALVWFPLCISLWFTGNTFAAVGLAIWGTVFVAGSDNILRPFFLRQGIKASFFVLILAILCGLSVFGAVGLILGPVLLAVAMQAYEEANHYYGLPGGCKP